MDRTSQSPQKSLDEELVAAFVSELGGVNGRELKLSREATRAAVIAGIEEATDRLARLNQYYPQQTAVFEHTKRLDQAVAQLEAELKNSPENFANFLFGPWPSERTATMPLDELETAIASDRRQFLEKLARMRAACQLQQEPPRHDVVKSHCAAVAFQLMQGLSRRPITSSPRSPFRTITALVHEALTGKPTADLKRQCDKLLHLIERKS